VPPPPSRPIPGWPAAQSWRRPHRCVAPGVVGNLVAVPPQVVGEVAAAAAPHGEHGGHLQANPRGESRWRTRAAAERQQAWWAVGGKRRRRGARCCLSPRGSRLGCTARRTPPACAYRSPTSWRRRAAQQTWAGRGAARDLKHSQATTSRPQSAGSAACREGRVHATDLPCSAAAPPKRPSLSCQQPAHRKEDELRSVLHREAAGGVGGGAHAVITPRAVAVVPARLLSSCTVEASQQTVGVLRHCFLHLLAAAAAAAHLVSGSMPDLM
jgi:hypothetical protein